MKFKYSIFICFIMLICSSCTVTNALQFKGYDNFVVSDIATKPRINADITLHNPNKVGATIREMNIALAVDNKEIGLIGFDDKVHIKRNADFVLPIEFTSSLDQLGGVLSFGLKSFISDEKIPVGLSGTITVQKFIFFRKTFSFDYTDALDIKKIKAH